MEPDVVVPVVEEVVVYAGWWVAYIGTALQVLAGLLIALLSWLAKKLITKLNMNEAEKEATQVLLEGMAVAQESIVREAKKIASDGKLTEAEIESAKAVAIAHAKSVATGPARKLLMKLGTERLGSWIKQLLNRFTKKKE